MTIPTARLSMAMAGAVFSFTITLVGPLLVSVSPLWTAALSGAVVGLGLLLWPLPMVAAASRDTATTDPATEVALFAAMQGWHELHRRLSTEASDLSDLADQADALRGALQTGATKPVQGCIDPHSMAAQVEDFCHRVRALALSLQATGAAGDEGRQALGQVDESIQGLGRDVDQAAEQLRRLRDSVQDIQTITQVITGIAEQTNLLALNAAIEAARAGDLGRGFAVVADEVRALAAKTTGATQDIARRLGDLRTEAGSAVQRMSGVLSHTERVTTAMQAVGNTYREIVSQVSAVGGDLQQIEGGLEQQGRDVKAVSSQRADFDQQMAVALQQLEALVGKARALAHQIDRLIEPVAGPMSAGGSLT